MTPFLFSVCQIGAEGALKREFLAAHEDLRLAYSRPGFVTFKRVGAAVPPDFPDRSVFARVWGASYGPVTSAEEVVDRLREVLGPCSGLRLHVFERDTPGLLDQPPPDTKEDEATHELEERIRLHAARTSPALFQDQAVSRPGDRVVDVILAPDERSFWLGLHRHGKDHIAYPGGRIPVAVPEHAPSRAYRKLEEACDFYRIPFAAGDLAVEVGSAPGGAAMALLRRGVRVIGIDPTEIDPSLLGAEGMDATWFRHIRLPVGQVRREDLPERVDWLLLDVNLAPQVALHSVHRLADRMQSTLLGVLFTLKLNEWRLAEQIPRFLRRIGAMGIVEPRVKQLPSNRQEVCVFGLTARGVKRAGTGVIPSR